MLDLESFCVFSRLFGLCFRQGRPYSRHSRASTWTAAQSRTWVWTSPSQGSQTLSWKRAAKMSQSQYTIWRSISGCVMFSPFQTLCHCYRGGGVLLTIAILLCVYFDKVDLFGHNLQLKKKHDNHKMNRIVIPGISLNISNRNNTVRWGLCWFPPLHCCYHTVTS